MERREAEIEQKEVSGPSRDIPQLIVSILTGRVEEEGGRGDRQEGVRV